MDTERFDRLVKSLSTVGTRRRLLRLVAPVPVAGGLLTWFEEVVQGQGNGAAVRGAGGRRRRRKARHRHDPGDDKNNRKGKRHGKGPCATVGQTPKRGNRRRCCAGLSKDATGRCAAATPCIGLHPTDDLQAAIDAATPGATLTLCPGTWLLRSSIVITQDLTLVGAGAGQTVLDGGGNPIRVLQIATGTTVTVQDLTITKGVSTAGFEGGGIDNKGTLRLLGVTVTGNMSEFGGGIRNNGTLTIAAFSSVSGNTADLDGGGIFNDGTLTLEGGSSVSGNSAGSSGGGINIGLGLATLKDGSSVTGNIASFGGGIYNVSGILTLEASSSVTGNTVGSFGGGIHNFGSVTLEAGSSVSGNTADVEGGGIYNDSNGLVTLKDGSSVTNNTAGSGGGGIVNFGDTVTVDAGALVCDNSDPQCAPLGTFDGAGTCPNPISGICPG